MLQDDVKYVVTDTISPYPIPLISLSHHITPPSLHPLIIPPYPITPYHTTPPSPYHIPLPPHHSPLTIPHHSPLAHLSSSTSWQGSHTLTGLADDGSGMAFWLQVAQKILPQCRQWCRRLEMLNSFSQWEQWVASLSGAQWASRRLRDTSCWYEGGVGVLKCVMLIRKSESLNPFFPEYNKFTFSMVPYGTAKKKRGNVENTAFHT